MKKKLALFLAMIMAVSTLAGCGGNGDGDASGDASGDGASGETIKIAFSGPMTGDYAEYGQNFLAAAEIAVDEVNAAGGLLDGQMVELVQYDDKNSQEEVGAIAEMIASDESIVAVGGHFSSGVAMTAANTYIDSGISLLSASASHPDYSSMGDYIFRNNILISQEIETVLQIVEASGAEKVGVLVLKNDWGQGALGALETAYAEVEGKVGFELVMQEEIMDGTEDFSANITKFTEAGVDGIFVLTMYASFAPFAIQYKAVDPEIKLFSVGSAFSQELINLGGEAVNGVQMCAGFDPSTEEPVAKAFVDTFKDKTGNAPDNMAVQTYENFMMICEAIERAGVADREAVKNELYNTDYEGITGHITFDEIGDAEKKMLVFEIVDETFVQKTEEVGLLPWDEFVASL